MAILKTLLQIQLMPGDIFLSQGYDIFPFLIRLASRQIGEDKTIFNHTGIITKPGNLRTAMLTEALWRVKEHSIWDTYYGKETKIAIYRHKNLEMIERLVIAREARSYIGNFYGVAKILTHAIDKTCFNDMNVTRRLTVYDKLPICSWITGKAYEKIHINFGKNAAFVDPDDIGDDVTSNTNNYQCIIPLTKLGD